MAAVDPGVLIRFRSWLDSGYDEPYAIEQFRSDVQALLAALNPAAPEPNSPWVVGLRFVKKYSVVRSFADRSGVMAVYGPVATEQLAGELAEHLRAVFDMQDLLEVIPIYEAIA